MVRRRRAGPLLSENVKPTRGTRRRGPSSATAFEREFPGGSESANACARALVRTYEAFIAGANQALRETGLSPAGRQALGALDGAGGTLSPTVLAQRLLVTPASVSSLVDTLERRGLVTRAPDPDDRRRVVVTITDPGRALVDLFLPRIVALQTAYFAGLDEQQRRALIDALESVRKATATLDGDAIVASAPPRVKP